MADGNEDFIQYLSLNCDIGAEWLLSCSIHREARVNRAGSWLGLVNISHQGKLVICITTNVEWLKLKAAVACYGEFLTYFYL